MLLLVALALVTGAGCGPSDPLESVRQRHARGDFAGSIEPLRDLLEERPEDGEVNYLYGRALLAAGEFGAATFPLRQAMEDPEWRRPAALELIPTGLANHDFNEVVEVTTRMLEDDPDDAVALLYRAQAQTYWRRDLEAALADAERAMELEPNLLEAYEPMILSLQGLDRNDEARAKLAEAGRRLEETDAPERLLAWHCSTSAIFAAEAGELEQAEETWVECLGSYPGDSTVVGNAVAYYDAHGQRDRSLEIMRTAHEVSENPVAFRLGLAGRMARAGEREPAEAMMRDATDAEEPRIAYAAWLDLARFLHIVGDHAGAAAAYESGVERIEEVEEPAPQVLFQWADALVVSGSHERALEVADRIQVPAQRSLILGRVAQERGDPAAALEKFDEALTGWPNNPWARYYTALAAERLGKFDRALEEYRYSIRIDPGATDARTRAAKLLTAEGQFRNAYQLLFLQVDVAPLDPEGELFSMYLMARAANPKQLQQAISELARTGSPQLPMALVRGARGAAEVAGAKGGLGLLQGAPGIDYTDPTAAPALLELVRYAHGAGRPELATQAVGAALAAHPEEPRFQEVRGLHLELSGAAESEAKAAYERALEADPNSAPALEGLARLALDEDAGRAARLFDRAYQADPSDPAPQLAVIRILREVGQTEDASERLETLLARHPYESDAALERVEIDLERESVSEDTLDLARRAARFGGGVEAYDRLSEVHAVLGDLAASDQAAERAQQLRERLATARAEG